MNALDLIVDEKLSCVDGGLQCCPPSSTTPEKLTTVLMSRLSLLPAKAVGFQPALTFSSFSHSLEEAGSTAKSMLLSVNFWKAVQSQQLQQ